jgi:DnaJ like chaperone protein
MDKSKKAFFDTIKNSISQIVSGDDMRDTKNAHDQRKKAVETELEFAIIILATEIMRISGNNTSNTEEALLSFLKKNFGMRSMALRRRQISDHIFVGPQPYTKMACEQIKSLATHESKFEIIRLLYSLAAADDLLRSSETAVIQKIARYLDIREAELKNISEQYLQTHSPFAILEIDETNSLTDVKIAYRKMVLKYHPDKREHTVSDEEANKKFREIKKAYEQIVERLKI